MSETKDYSRQKPRKKRGCVGCGWWVEIPVTLLIVIVLAGICMPNVNRVNDKPKEAQVKEGLHSIQVALEQYAVDTGGTYPPYLIGGEGRHSTVVEESADAFIDIQDCTEQTLLSDPLLRKGYLQAYPKNPFAANGVAIHRFQEDRKDPLRNGTEEAKLHGTRFGAACNLMGSVIADNRYPGTYADFGYPYYDLWEMDSTKPHPFIPGEFFYRSRSVLVSTHNEDDRQLITEEVQDYMLGAYGSIRTKGRDIFGPDPTGENEVSPFSAGGAYGNTNGIRDSIILVLVPGEDTG